MKDFWLHRGNLLANGDLGLWQSTSLTSSELAAVDRRSLELEHILGLLLPGGNLLELGCGCGRLTVSLSPFFSKIYSYDYVPEFIEIARGHGLSNVEFTCGDVLSFDRSVKFDSCLIAGLLLHLTDASLSALGSAISSIPYLIVKESVGTAGRYLVDGYSEELGCNYSAIYRGVSELEQFFTNLGYKLEHSEPIEHHRLETHLRIFLFTK